jgi:hypothetical protein
MYFQDYCEVGYVDIDFSSSSNSSPTSRTATSSLIQIKDLLLPEATTPNSITLPVVGTDIFKAYLSIFREFSHAEFANMTSDAVVKLVNVDVDPARKSNRVEWASAVYRSHYHPLCAFELEIQWEIATGSLLADLVMVWSKLANRCNYHIVAAPVDPFATPIVPNSDPLRGPIFIRLNLASLMSNEKIIFENYIQHKYRVCFDELERYVSAESAMSISPASGSPPQSETGSSSLPSATSVDSAHTGETVLGGGHDVNMSTRAAKLNNGLMRFLCEHAPKFEEFVGKKFAAEAADREIGYERSGFVSELFAEFIEFERIIRLQIFQESILEK